jgi:dTDP-glucose 4,6-dehydratase
MPLGGGFAIGDFVDHGLRGEDIVVNGDGTPRRSYLYAADLAVWLWTILFEGAAGRPYHVGSPIPVSIAEAAEAVSRAFGRAVGVRIARGPESGMQASSYYPCVDRAAAELGLQRYTDLDTALDRTVAWHRFFAAG